MLNKKRRPLISVFVAMVLAAAAILLIMQLSGQTSIPNDADLSLTLERTACFGRCPIYRITVEDDGTVTYFGEMFVAVEGEKISHIGPDQVRKLARELEKVDFLSLQDEYTDMNATDMPSAITTLRLNGEEKTVLHYYGDLSAPEKLTDLENFIDAITNSIQWIESSTQWVEPSAQWIESTTP